jgi:DNA-binding transcriptional regulator YiaG
MHSRSHTTRIGEVGGRSAFLADYTQDFKTLEICGMPNIGSVLKEEISRLSRREIRRETAMMRRASVAYRHDIAALKRKVMELERSTAHLAKAVASQPAQAAQAPDRPMRFAPKGLKSLRERLGLSQAKFAKLIGVSDQSMYNWERGKSRPRKEQIAAIAGVRGLGKREAQARLQSSATEEKTPVPKRRDIRRASAKKGRLLAARRVRGKKQGRQR